jgi:hypothetical protein
MKRKSSFVFSRKKQNIMVCTIKEVMRCIVQQEYYWKSQTYRVEMLKRQMVPARPKNKGQGANMDLGRFLAP